ncbi:MAG: hypothetical protein RJB38_1961 [Pseudomonadota bacterium]
MITGSNWWEQLQSQGVTLLATLFLAIYLASWADMKVGADLQARVGPNRAGRAGILQPLANFLRTLLKVGPISKVRKGGASHLWWVHGLPLFMMAAVVPVSSGGPLLQAPLAIFTPLALGLLFSWSGLLMAWRLECVETRFWAIRQAALSLAAIPPALLSVVVAGLEAGGFEWAKIGQSQEFLPSGWILFSSPWAFIAGLIFFLCGALLFSMSPFSGAPLVGHSALSANSGKIGVREVWISAGRRLAPICWNLMALEVFMGGSHLPAGLLAAAHGLPILETAFRILLLLLKLQCIDIGIVLVSRTLPVVRVEQSYDFAWRVLSPAAVLCLMAQRLVMR